MSGDSHAALAAEQEAVARLFENFQKQAQQEPQVDSVTKAVVALLNVAVPGRTCLICAQDVENHAERCPISGLEQWINPSMV
jgi:hypothetical protein